MNLKAKDIHFLYVTEKETISQSVLSEFYINQNFFGFKGKLSVIKSIPEMTAIIFKLLNFCFKEPLIAYSYICVMVTFC